MNRGIVIVVALCFGAAGALGLAACGSSSRTAAPKSSGPTSASGTSSRPSTTRAAPPTTRHLSAVEADQAAQFALTAAINAAQTIYRETSDYTAVSPASLAARAPNLHFGDVSQSSKSVVGVLAQDRNDVLLVTRSGSGHWYCVIDNAMDGLSYGEGSSRDVVDSNGECQQPAWPPPGQAQPSF